MAWAGGSGRSSRRVLPAIGPGFPSPSCLKPAWRGPMTASGRSPDEIWLAATWPYVRDHLPPARVAVTEAGCGASGGHVPALLRAGYQATGVDPQAPDGPAYRQIRFEDYQPERPAAAV